MYISSLFLFVCCSSSSSSCDDRVYELVHSLHQVFLDLGKPKLLLDARRLHRLLPVLVRSEQAAGEGGDPLLQKGWYGVVEGFRTNISRSLELERKMKKVKKGKKKEKVEPGE